METDLFSLFPCIIRPPKAVQHCTTTSYVDYIRYVVLLLVVHHMYLIDSDHLHLGLSCVFFAIYIYMYTYTGKHRYIIYFLLFFFFSVFLLYSAVLYFRTIYLVTIHTTTTHVLRFLLIYCTSSSTLLILTKCLMQGQSCLHQGPFHSDTHLVDLNHVTRWQWICCDGYEPEKVS